MKPTTALHLALAIAAALTLFHLAILFQIIPYEIVWGGRLTNEAEMYRFESVSLALNLLFGLLLLIKGGLLKPILPPKIVTVGLWLFFALFVLNTVGNLLAKTYFEKGFTVVTLLLCVLIWTINRNTFPKTS